MGKKTSRSQVNITVAIAVHPPQGETEQSEVSVEVGQAGFVYGTPDDEEEDDDEEDSLPASR